jgi:hypothetical protein
VKVASSPVFGLRKPILKRPSIVSSCTWSGMSARNSTVASPAAILDRSAYSRALMLRLSAAKFSLPTTSSLPSVEMRRMISPLKTSLDA